jgi:hypothetical protein
MKVQHPTIRHGQVGHPRYGTFAIEDGVLDCPPELAAELGARPVPEGASVVSEPEPDAAPEPPETPDPKPPRRKRAK